MMRILFVIDSLTLGGAEKSLVELLTSLPSRGLHIDLLRVSGQGVLEKFVPGHIHRHILRRFPDKGIRSFVSTLRRGAMAICRTIAPPSCHPAEYFWRFMGPSVPPLGGHYDLAIAYHQGFPTYYVATKVNASRKIAWVNADVTSVGYDPAFNSRFYSAFDSVVTVSAPLRSLFLKAHPSLAPAVTVINDIVNPDSLRRLAMAFPDPFPPRDGALRILTVARLLEVKGHDLAIDAAVILRDRGIRFRWYFVGEGNRHDHIVRRISDLGLGDNVFLTGAMDNPYPWFENTDIYVQPSLSEGYGIAISEAKIFQRPVIATDFPAAHTLVDSSVGIIAPMSGSGIADAVITLSDPSVRKRLTENLARHTNLSAVTELAKVCALFGIESPAS